MESPGTKLVTEAGMAVTPLGWARSSCRVADCTLVVTGVVRSVNEPWVPRPAIPAAAPMTARDARILRAVS
jgi:hypothetical protein